MKELLENGANIISEAAKSPLGIAALLAIVIGTIAIAFFQDAPVALKAISFALVTGVSSLFCCARDRQAIEIDEVEYWDGT